MYGNVGEGPEAGKRSRGCKGRHFVALFAKELNGGRSLASLVPVAAGKILFRAGLTAHRTMAAYPQKSPKLQPVPRLDFGTLGFGSSVGFESVGG